jgi:PPOX class probable F420-dependent enzyme
VDEVERLSAGKYLSLTTFRKDGTPVATPVWVARDGESLVVTTERSSGKAKRLRNNSKVLLAPCDMRGRPTGDEVDGTAELTDDAGTKRVSELIGRRYGLQYRLIFLVEKIRRRARDSVGIRITPAP